MYLSCRELLSFCLFVVSLLLNILVLMKDIHRSKSLEVINITKILFHNRHAVSTTRLFKNVRLALHLRIIYLTHWKLLDKTDNRTGSNCVFQDGQMNSLHEDQQVMMCTFKA